MITRTVGSSGADHVDLNAWVAYVQANYVSGGNLTDHQTVKVKAVGFSTTASQVVSGWAPGGSNYTTTITADTGASARDNASVQSNAFAFNSSNGAFISGNSASSPTVSISVDKLTVSDIQIRTTGGSDDIPLQISTSSPTSLLVEGCILDGTSADGILNAPNIGDNLTVRLCLVAQRRGASQSAALTMGRDVVPSGSGNKAYRNTLVNLSGASNGVGIHAGSYGIITAVGNAIYSFAKPIDARQANTSGDHNATDLSSWVCTFGSGNLDSQLTNSQFSFTSSNEFVSDTTDFRVKSATSTKLKDHGTAVSGITTDFARTTVPSGTTEDIGAWELVQGGGGAFTLTSALGTFSLSGQNAGLRSARKLAMAKGTFTESGQNASLRRGYSVPAVKGTFTETGQAANFKRGLVLTSAKGTFTETGQAAALRISRKIAAAAAAFTLSGKAAVLSKGFRITAAPATFTEAGQAAALRAARRLAMGASSFTLTGKDATLVKSGGGSHTLVAGGQSFALTGQAAVLRAARRLAMGTGAFTFAGQAAALRTARKLAMGQGALTLTGQAAALRTARKLAMSKGTFTLTGNAAGLVHGVNLLCAAGVFTYVGKDAAMEIVRYLLAQSGTFIFNGIDVRFQAGEQFNFPDTELLVAPWVQRTIVVALEPRTVYAQPSNTPFTTDENTTVVARNRRSN